MLLVNSRLGENEKICGEMSFIIRKNENAYEDDGNTRTPGYAYEAYWCFQLNPNTSIETYNIIGEHVYQEECLFFQYVDNERIRDHKSDGSGRFFKLNFCRIELLMG